MEGTMQHIVISGRMYRPKAEKQRGEVWSNVNPNSSIELEMAE